MCDLTTISFSLLFGSSLKRRDMKGKGKKKNKKEKEETEKEIKMTGTKTDWR